jgi:cytochrome c
MPGGLGKKWTLRLSPDVERRELEGMSRLMKILRIAAAHIPFLVLACGGSTPSSNAPPPPSASAGPGAPATAPAASTFAEQVAQGQQLYADNCASCHGASGTGGPAGKAPPIVGLKSGALPLNPPPTAKLRKTQFRTVADVAGFVMKNMPPSAPGSLPPDQYWSILAFNLKANGINLDKKLDASTAQSIVIPR